ncbi:MAG: peptide deformylase [Christensenellaceae bacterium]|jgi:peptide deformylase|nr:peptide deformylase [Christensenellaceae bacterium]
MALRNIIKHGDPALRKNSRKVTSFNERLSMLLDDMKETMDHFDGVGLAAPQISILRCVAIVEFEGEFIEMINPEIIESSGDALALEGCLSILAKHCLVSRPETIKYTYQTRNGEQITNTASGWLARIICHEIDHLSGILMIDKEQKPTQ